MSKFRKLLIGVALSGVAAGPLLAQAAAPAPDAAAADTAAAPAATAGRFGLGREALPEEIAAWDVNVMPDGDGLPEGQGSVADGEMLFSDNCAACHGEFAEGVDNWPELAGGFGTLDRDDPVKTVGSFWPYLSTAWDYVHRSMPYGSAQTLSAEDTYAIVAYILYSNDLVDEDFVLTRENFTEVEMPNADGFIVDDRDTVELPLFVREPCMENCKESVEITMRAANLDVTPDDTSDDPAGEATPQVSLEGGADALPADTEGGEEGAPSAVPAEGAEAAAAAEATRAQSAESADAQPATETGGEPAKPAP